jgi:3-phosphoglycerate kinase
LERRLKTSSIPRKLAEQLEIQRTGRGSIVFVHQTLRCQSSLLTLPSDIIVNDAFDKDANYQVVAADAIPDGWMGLDNGPETTKEQKEALSTCKTIIMNGPMGFFECEKFAAGTFGIEK